MQARRRIQVMTKDDAVNIDDFLRAEGYDSDEALHEGRVVLERHHLTRPGKHAFVAEKLPRARLALNNSLVRVCAGCRPNVPRGEMRLPVPVAATHCELCSGSNNRRAAARALAAMRRKRIERIVVVGGTPAQQHDLRPLLEGIDVRFVDGTRASHNTKEAELNKRWAQLIVIWAPTPLKHQVSDRYSEIRYPGLKVVTVPRRGIAALCDEVTRALQ
jgi:hypothetical protein